VRDQWVGREVKAETEEVEHALTGCNGSVEVVRVHHHTEHCRCMIPVWRYR
jgi:hypothetical protein